MIFCGQGAPAEGPLQSYNMTRIAVIGAGSWGTALSIVAARAGNSVTIWGRSSSVVDSINSEHVNNTYLPDAPVPEQVVATKHFPDALKDAEFVILAAPSHATRELLKSMAPEVPRGAIIVSATKGIEVETGKRISELVSGLLDESYSRSFVCL